MSINLSLADKVAASINTLSLGVEAVTELYSELDREEASGELVIQVSSFDDKVESFSRTASKWDIEISIVFTKLVEDENADTRSILAQVDQVMEHFLRTSALSVDNRNHQIREVNREDLFNQQLLKDNGVFQSVITVGFSAIR